MNDRIHIETLGGMALRVAPGRAVMYAHLVQWSLSRQSTPMTATDNPRIVPTLTLHLASGMTIRVQAPEWVKPLCDTLGLSDHYAQLER